MVSEALGVLPSTGPRVRPCFIDSGREGKGDVERSDREKVRAAREGVWRFRSVDLDVVLIGLSSLSFLSFTHTLHTSTSPTRSVLPLPSRPPRPSAEG